MAGVPDYSRPTTPDGGPNGILTPRTPKQTGLALTEYSANPSPPSDSPKPSTTNQGVPDAFLLPTGYPDVCPPSAAAGPTAAASGPWATSAEAHSISASSSRRASTKWSRRRP